MAQLPDSVRVKLARADHHINDLDSRITVFLNSGPYKTIGEIDSQGRPTYRVSSIQPIDPLIPAIAGETIQSLRTALDYMACALWLRTNPGGTCKVYLPIIATAARYHAEGLRQIKGMGQDAIDAITAIEPYGGGKGDLLWRLHNLSIIDKHRLPITIVGANLGVHLPSVYPDFFPEAAKANLWILGVSDLRFSLKDGDVLFVDEPRRELKHNLHFPFFIALDEPGVMERRPLIQTLRAFEQSAGDVVSGLATLLV